MILAGELQLMKLQRRGLGLAMSSPCCLVKSVAQKKKKPVKKEVLALRGTLRIRQTKSMQTLRLKLRSLVFKRPHS